MPAGCMTAGSYGQDKTQHSLEVELPDAELAVARRQVALRIRERETQLNQFQHVHVAPAPDGSELSGVTWRTCTWQHATLHTVHCYAASSRMSWRSLG